MCSGSQPVYGWEILRTKRSCSFLNEQSCLFMMAHFFNIDKCLSAEDFPASGKSCPIIVEKKMASRQPVAQQPTQNIFSLS